jgi:two-component system, cell cycle sensor histidine kinase and response regulator CckA
VSGNLSQGSREMEREDEMFDLLVEAKMSSIKARTLTRRLLSFSNGDAPVKETASIEDTFQKSSSFTVRGSNSAYESSMDKGPWASEIDTGQISQAISEIVLNAAEAMPEGDNLRIVADNLIIEENSGMPFKPGKYIRISITDNGAGITEKHLAGIFAPYSTINKKGCGLELAAEYSTIKKHEENVSIESQSGISRTFTVYLPSPVKILNGKEEVNLIKYHGRVMAMDDEISLRKTVVRALKGMSYESEGTIDRAMAIQKYKITEKSGQAFDDAILDLTI